MFVGDQMELSLDFDAARDGLASLARGGWFNAASADAYSDGLTGLARVGPLGSAPGISRLVEVRCQDLVVGEDSVALALRWEVIGPGGGLFPALDANITLIGAGEQATLLRLDGAYRPPLGRLGAGLDRVILHRVATDTIRSFLSRVAAAIAATPDAAGRHPADEGGQQQGQVGRGARPETA